MDPGLHSCLRCLTISTLSFLWGLCSSHHKLSLEFSSTFCLIIIFVSVIIIIVVIHNSSYKKKNKQVPLPVLESLKCLVANPFIVANGWVGTVLMHTLLGLQCSFPLKPHYLIIQPFRLLKGPIITLRTLAFLPHNFGGCFTLFSL